MRRLTLIALLAVAAGCGGAERASDADGNAGGGSGGAAKGLRSTVTYERSGGLAGRVSRLTITTRGRARLASRGEATVRFEVGRTARGRLARRLRAAHVAGRRADFSPRTPVADGMGHRVRYADGEVTTATGGDAPQSVEALVATLDDLVDRHAP